MPVLSPQKIHEQLPVKSSVTCAYRQTHHPAPCTTLLTSTCYPSGQESNRRSHFSCSKHLPLSDLPICLNYFSSAQHHDSSVPATVVCSMTWAKTIFGSRACCHAAPSVWNSLPPQLTTDFNSVFLSTFKRNLKTHFYRLSFKS